MPAATSKDELLAVTEKEFAKLNTLIDEITVDDAMRMDEDRTSIKDTIAHRAHWIDLFLGWYRDGQAGKTVCFPAEGYKWSDLKRYNADLRESQRDLGWTDACEQLRSAHGRLLTFLSEHTNDELYGGPMAGAKNEWTPGRWAEAAGPSHYRSAAKYLRSRRRAFAATA